MVFRSFAAQLAGLVLCLKLVLQHGISYYMRFLKSWFLNPQIPVCNCSVARSWVSFEVLQFAVMLF